MRSAANITSEEQILRRLGNGWATGPISLNEWAAILYYGVWLFMRSRIFGYKNHQEHAGLAWWLPLLLPAADANQSAQSDTQSVRSGAAQQMPPIIAESRPDRIDEQ